MKTISTKLLFALLIMTISPTGFALTIDQSVSPAYVRVHPQEFAVEVHMGKSGLLSFTITRTLSEPKHLVAHLSIQQEGKPIAESHTPSLAKSGKNTFYFSISPKHLAETTFEISESFAPDGIPLPGTKRFSFQIKEFVPETLLPSAP